VDLMEDHRRLVLQILRAHLPERTSVWLFGSRATGRAKRYSDINLAIDAGRPLTLDEVARLAEALSESDLPYRVDLVDWQGLDDGWRQAIASERIALTEPFNPAGGGGPAGLCGGVVQRTGRMFWLIWKTFSGSYLVFNF
jgi:predicted nucleotidyltransferase